MKLFSSCQLGHQAAVMSSSMPTGHLLPHTDNFYSAKLHVMFVSSSITKCFKHVKLQSVLWFPFVNEVVSVKKNELQGAFFFYSSVCMSVRV